MERENIQIVQVWFFLGILVFLKNMHFFGLKMLTE